MKFQTWSFILGVGLPATQSLAYDVGEMVRYGKELFLRAYK